MAAQKKEQQKKLASVQADLNKQKRLLANARVQRGVDRNKLTELEARRKALEEKRIHLEQSGDASLREVENLNRDIVHLQGRINEILKFTAVE